MDDFVGEVSRGFFRFIGYILAEIFFATICYWVGWPICKLITFGKYPSSRQIVYLDDYAGRRQGFWCAAVGLIVIIMACVILVAKISPGGSV